MFAFFFQGRPASFGEWSPCARASVQHLNPLFYLPRSSHRLSQRISWHDRFIFENFHQRCTLRRSSPSVNSYPKPHIQSCVQFASFSLGIIYQDFHPRAIELGSRSYVSDPLYQSKPISKEKNRRY